MTRFAFVLTACLAPAAALAATPVTFGGALDPVSGCIALAVAGAALWARA